MARINRSIFVLGLTGAILLPGTGRAGDEGVELPIPAGVLPLEIPADNPPTPARVELGKKLYFDRRLSTDGTVACATCHDPAHAFVDPRGTPTSAGVGGALGVRNAPTVLNAAFLASQFWDGREPTLEAQAVQPLINPVEHGFADHPAVVARLRSLDDYAASFEAAFGSREIDIQRVGRAIASFERTLLSLDAPIERYLAGESDAISESAQRGWDLFNGKARCNSCHGHIAVLPLFTDDLFHNIGVGVENVDFKSISRRAEAAVASGRSIDELAVTNREASSLGRFLVTHEPKDLGAFKTPQLRNVALTAPYMHDGSEATLEDVIAFYDRGGNPNPYLDGGMRPLGLTDSEKADLAELLKTFTSRDLERFESLNNVSP